VSFVSRLQDATIGFSGYPRLARDPASGFGYLALFLFIVLTISGLITTQQVRTTMAEMRRELVKTPDFALENGQVSFAGPMPYTIRESSGAVIIIDTTGQTTEADLRGAKPGSALITRDKVYQTSTLGRTQTTDLRQIPVRVRKADVMNLMEYLHWFVPVCYLFLYGFQLGFKALDAVMLAAIALMYGLMVKREVSFNLGFKLGLYAMTLPTLIQWLYPNFHTFEPKGFVIWWGLAVLYLLMGLRASLAASDEAPIIVAPPNP